MDEFFIFSQGCTRSRGRGCPNTFQNFCGSCYNIQFKSYVTSKVELFMRKLLLAVVKQIELCRKCERPPRSDPGIHH